MANDDSSVLTVDGADTETQPAPPRPERAARWRRPGVAVAALLVAALLAVATTLLIQVLRDRNLDVLRTEAIDTARDYSVALSSFDFENLDANRDAITAQSTQAFADKYADMVDALRQIVTDGKGKATATAAHVGVESLDADRAVVLVFVDQHATNVVAPDGNTQQYRMVVTLVRDGDRWIVDNVDTN
ncbi:mce associated protein mas1a [Rhodococcus sp. NPDC054953]